MDSDIRRPTQALRTTGFRSASRDRVAGLVVGIFVALTACQAAWAQPQLMPQRPLVRGFGGLCDGGPLACTRIDQIAFHAGADPTVLPSTSLRGLGLVASYGFSVGILQHVEGSNGTLQPQRDIDFTDHGTPDIHPNPHQHTLTPNNSTLAPQGGFKRGPAEPL